MFKKALIFSLIVFSQIAHALDYAANVGTEFPIGLHGDFELRKPEWQLYSKLRYAVFLESYTDGMNSVALDYEFYNQGTADIISEVLKGADFIEFAIGWSRQKNESWFIEVSYSYIKGDGQVSGSTITEAVSDVVLPTGSNIYDIEGEIYSLGLRTGYVFQLADKQSLILSLGVLKPQRSKTSLDRETSGPVQEALLNSANRRLDAYLDEVLKNDVYIPVLGATWSYNF